PAGDFEAYRKEIRPKLVEGGDVKLGNAPEQLVRATGRVAVGAGSRGLLNSLVVCSGDLAAPGKGPGLQQRAGVGCSVVLAGGDVEVDMAEDAVLVCSGEARLTGDAVGSVVIARGPVRISKVSTLNSVNVIQSAGEIKRPENQSDGTALAESEVDRPLDFVR